MDRIPLAYQLRCYLGAPLRKRAVARRSQFLERARQSCQLTQQATLDRLLQLNHGSEFSSDFGLTPGMSLAEFRKRIPVAGYELEAPYIEKMKEGNHRALLGEKNRLMMYALTSGTTSDSKMIPITEQFVRDYRRGWQVWGIGSYKQYPVLQRLNIVQVVSNHRRFTTADGTPCGNISGLVAATQTISVRSLYTIPADLTRVEDPDAKRLLLLRLAVADPYVGLLITANPSTILQLAELLQSRGEELIRSVRDGSAFGDVKPNELSPLLRRRLRPRPGRAAALQQLANTDGSLLPSKVWPWMTLLGVWTGGSCGAYLPRLKELFPGLPLRDHGLHASEGRMTIPVEDNTSAGVLDIDSHFFEFVPLEEADKAHPQTLLAHELREGEEYFILLTTSSGLYRYNIRDVVRCTGFFGTTPLLEFRHKGSHISSITGEKLAESQVVEAMKQVGQQHAFAGNHFTLTPEWGEPPGYTLYLSGDGAADAGVADLVADALDIALRAGNLEYREKRESGRLRSVRCQFLNTEQWATFTRTRQSRSGGSAEQYKHPCLLPDPQFDGVFRETCGLD